MQAHLAAAGDLLDFVQVAAGSVEVVLPAVELGAGEEAPSHPYLLARGAEAVDGFVESLGGLGEVAQGQGGPAQGQMVQADAEERITRYAPLEELLSPALGLGWLTLGEQQVAIPKARQ